ncbi:hypothetical protein BWD42_07490 [Sphingobacterium sp. CZ-UAM]|uniref:hypothetical protein n=1 Tax=Sphingobacterium sp. CZ-UAM TaxID=1933868 RepID=UPI000984B104|nr:hypothetical protein [Sphingobacterium sp. CZ-UAM]OOG19736.1 hypothetical protein BWD42_07490 [Sphingobacterium sp. CZ-UAM]
MKKRMIFNSRPSLLLAMAIGLFTVSLQGCRSKDDVQGIAGGTTLVVRVNGVNDHTAGVKGVRASLKRGSSGSGTHVLAERKIYEGEGFDVVASIEAAVPVHRRGDSVAAVAKGGTKAAVPPEVLQSQPMASGVQYRLLIYNASDVNHTAPVVNQVASSGTNLGLMLDAGKTYQWYAVTVNSTTEVPTITSGVVSGADSKGKDLMLAQGTVTTVVGENSLGINFDRMTAQFQLTVDNRGMSGEIQNPAAIVSLLSAGDAPVLKYGDFDIFTSSYSNVNSYSLADVPAPTKGRLMLNYTLYTADTSTVVPAGGLRLKTAGLQIKKLDYFYRPYDATVTFPAKDLVFNNVAFTPQRGGVYKISYELAESGVKVNGKIWARTNAVYLNDPTLKDSLMGFAPLVDKGPFINGRGYYTPVYHLGPLNLGAPLHNPAAGEDPCALVYPQGIWRLPTQAEFEALLPLSSTKTTEFMTATNETGIFGIEYALDAGETALSYYPQRSQQLFFPLWGKWTRPGGTQKRIVNGGCHVSVTSNNVTDISGYYWFRNPDGSTGQFHIKTSYVNRAIGAWTVNTRPDSGDPNTNYTVRCVRAL